MNYGQTPINRDELMASIEKARQEMNAPEDDARINAIKHVEWFLAALRPLLIDHFVHGYKHGREDMAEEFRKGLWTPEQCVRPCECDEEGSEK